MQPSWHSITASEVMQKFGVTSSGLSKREAAKRLSLTGPNKIAGHKKPGVLSAFLSQFADPMVLTLLFATAISVALGELVDAGVILFIVALNAGMGALQEARAERALEALQAYAPPTTTVIRSGKEMEVDRESVVPGDVLLLRPGARVAADGRLLFARSLQVEEAALTGESMPVAKDSSLILPHHAPPSERRNMVYAGTLVTRGEGAAVVTDTGMDTEMGGIARMVTTAKGQKTPLEKRLESLGKTVLFISGAACATLAVIGFFRGLPFYDVFLTGVSLAVAAVPEGLPAVVTLCFAVGVQRMARAGAVVRKLEAIETLGSVTLICTDKTGTLTRNVMEVMVVALASSGKEPIREVGKLKERGRGDPDILEILKTAVLASDARSCGGDPASGEDPTEQAIVACASLMGLDVSRVDALYPRLSEEAFTSERRMMSTQVKEREGMQVCSKGAPDTIIPKCTRKLVGNRVLMLSEQDKKAWAAWVERQAGAGMRVLAVAKRAVGLLQQGAGIPEESLTLLGCLALADPLRPEAGMAVMQCKRAGIRPVLVTGDHLKTAESVARQVGILELEEQGMIGEALDRLKGPELAKAVDGCRVFARVSPAHKLKIVRQLKKLGHVVAMTGDGINDAPALKESAVGVAMGKTGTDVARESSSIVLMDDNFSTVVKAVEEGRAIYDNLRKFIRYLLSCNLGEVITMLGALIMGLPLPLYPVQILMMNLVTDGLPALALGMEPPERDLMKRPPRDPSEGLFSHGLMRRIVGRGAYIGIITLVLFLSGLAQGDVDMACTLAYATLVTVQLVAAFDCRSETKTALEIGLTSNMYLVWACVLSWLVLYATIQLPFFSRLFHTVSLPAGQWLVILCAALLPDAFRYAFSSKNKD